MSLKESFMALAPRFGLTPEFVAKYYEQQYLKYASKRGYRDRLVLKTVYKVYPTGRKKVPEKPEEVFRTYNDGKTKPSADTIKAMTAKALELTKDCKSDSQKLLKICKWVDKVAVYKTDSERWGKTEYWSSPFDIWQSIQEKGQFEDDCDGFSVFTLQMAVLAGIPKNDLFVRCGMAQAFGTKEGHANILFMKDGYDAFYAEGSFYPQDCWRRWEQFKLDSKRYPDTWFCFNTERTAVFG